MCLGAVALLRMVAPGAGFRDDTLFWHKIGEDQKKKRSPQIQWWVFGPNVDRNQTTKQVKKSKVLFEAVF